MFAGVRGLLKTDKKPVNLLPSCNNLSKNSASLLISIRLLPSGYFIDNFYRNFLVHQQVIHSILFWSAQFYSQTFDGLF